MEAGNFWVYPGIDPFIVNIGPIGLRWYSMAYIAGIVLGWVYVRQLLKSSRLWPEGRASMVSAQIDDLVMWVTLGVILGGRLGHVLFYQSGYYFSHPLEILMIWNGGMSFHGGLLGVTLAMYLYARRHEIDVLKVSDLVSAAVPIGLFFGRIANFINQEVVGSPTTVPWAIIFPGIDGQPRHPAMLYEAALEGIALFFILRYLTHSRLSLKWPGLTTGAFLCGYGVFRIFVEFFKFAPHRMVAEGLPITKGMLLSLPMLALGIFLIHLALKAKPVSAPEQPQKKKAAAKGGA